MATKEVLTPEQLMQLNNWARWELGKTALLKKWWWRLALSVFAALVVSWIASRLHSFPLGHWVEAVGLTLGVLGAWLLAGSVLLPRRRIDAMSGLEEELKEYLANKGRGTPTSDELARYAYAWTYQVGRDLHEDAVRNWLEGWAGMVTMLVGFLLQLVGLVLD